MQDPNEQPRRAASPEEAMARIEALMNAIETELEIQRQAVDILSGQSPAEASTDDPEPPDDEA